MSSPFRSSRVGERVMLVRDRLLERLGARWSTLVTVVGAPAGYGKTTLMAQAIAANEAAPVGVDHRLSCRPDVTTASFLGEALGRAVAAGPYTEPDAQDTLRRMVSAGRIATKVSRPPASIVTMQETLHLASSLLATTPAEVEELGAGETFLCYGAGDVALLLPRFATGAVLGKLWRTCACAALARDLGARTPAVLAVRSSPTPHALCERGQGPARRGHCSPPGRAVRGSREATRSPPPCRGRRCRSPRRHGGRQPRCARHQLAGVLR